MESEDRDVGGVPSYMVTTRPRDEVLLLSKRTDHDELLASIVKNLTGVEIVKSPNGNLIMREGKFQIINLEGATFIFNFLRMRVNMVTTLTNFNEEEIGKHLENGVGAFQKWIYLNHSKYGLEKELLESFVDGFRTMFHAQLNRALNGAENKAVTESRSTQNVRYDIDDKRKKATFNPMNSGEGG